MVKKNIITLNLTRFDGKSVKWGNTARFTVQFFDGIQDFYFHLKKGEVVTLHYEAEIEEGTLAIQIAPFATTANHIVTLDELTEDKTGEYTFTPEKKRYVVRLKGSKTKGSCKIKFH